MSYKRSRSTFEADGQASYATFGTPLPDEAETRDDGAYLPLWKQEVRDERGLKRLHGAFTGGWSAGYFNTVGSKEGWTPSTFVSSRDNRRKDEVASSAQRPEDYMDEEDLADAAEAQKLQTSQAFAGLGASTEGEIRAGGLMRLFRTRADTVGLKLLRRMGWKDGQGIGPKVRRGARLDVEKPSETSSENSYLFAPVDVQMIQFIRKADRQGLGYRGAGRLSSLSRPKDADFGEDDENSHPKQWDQTPSLSFKNKPKPRAEKGGIGVGILNNDGSDEDDPYEMGPKISYNRVIGGEKKKKRALKKLSAATNPALGKAPVFVPKMARMAANSTAKCHDGCPPLEGFILANVTEDLARVCLEYTPPPVPIGWKSTKSTSAPSSNLEYTSTADVAKASTHNPKSRAAILGEKALPGKSVFDFVSSSTRDRLAAVSGQKNLPPGRGEIPEGYVQTMEQTTSELLEQAPKLDRETAIAALSRSSTGPYANDEMKMSRYKQYLQWQANIVESAPIRPTGMLDKEFVRELTEFHGCANIFKPMTGFIGSRFTTGTSGSSQPHTAVSGEELSSEPNFKDVDTAEEAARAGMFGQMTRVVEDFYPTRLLCKRFNVKTPAHAQSQTEPQKNSDKNPASLPAPSERQDTRPAGFALTGKADEVAASVNEPVGESNREVLVNPQRNEAVEGAAANAEILHAIFGDSDSD